MMNNNLKFGLLVIGVCFCISCGSTQRLTFSKQAYLRDFNRFIEQVKRDYPTYNSSDWKWADDKYDLFTGSEYDFYAGTYTEKEKEEIGRLKGAYAKVKLKKTAGAVKEGIKDAFSTGKGIIKGLLE